MSWCYSWVVSLLSIPLSPYLTIVTKFEPLCGLKEIAFHTVLVCDPLNISVVGGKSFCSTIKVCEHFPISLVTQKCLENKSKNRYFVAMEFTVQVSTFVELKLLWNR